MRKIERFNIGVTFCGGCNPYFDREKLYREVAAEFSGTCDFSLYSEGQFFDIVLLINGCQSECLMDVDYKSRLIVINDRNYTDSTEIIKTALHQIKK